MKTYSQNIINLLLEDFIIKDNNFKLKSLICSPYSGHYTTILIDILKTNIFSIKILIIYMMI